MKSLAISHEQIAEIAANLLLIEERIAICNRMIEKVTGVSLEGTREQVRSDMAARKATA